MRLIFAGTPTTAVPSLRHLVDRGHEVVAVLTREPAPVGRKRVVTPSPVQQAAEELGLTVLTPRRLAGDVVDEIMNLRPDAAAVVAYGMLIREPLLSAFPWVNLHFSLLPAWRGAAPVPFSIAAGDNKSGMSTFVLNEGLDTGDVISMSPEAIQPTDSADSLLERLAQRGPEFLEQSLVDLHEGRIIPQPQPREGASHAPKITSADAEINWHQPAAVVDREIRAWTSHPGAWTTLEGARMKVGAPAGINSHEGAKPGEVIVIAGVPAVGTTDGVVLLDMVAPPGKPWMSAASWLRGRQGDTRLGSS